MRRTLAAALLLLLLLPAGAQAATRTQILRDCEQDSKIDGTYTRAELTDALESLPTDQDGYTDCRDVLSRARLDLAGAAAAGTRRRGDTGGGGGTGPGVTGAGQDVAPALRSGGAGTASRALDAATPQEREAVARATTAGRDARVQVGDAVLRAPTAASSALPAPLLLLVGMLGLSVVGGLVHALRSRFGRAAKG